MFCSFFSQALRWLLTLTPLTPNDNTPQGIRLFRYAQGTSP